MGEELIIGPLSFQVAALLAATSWAIGGLVSAGPVSQLGGPRFTRIRMYWVATALVLIATLIGDWTSLSARTIALLAASGFVGLALGDAALFTALFRLGPRRTGILFALNAPITAAISAIIFAERFSLRALAGSVLILLGVALAIGFGTQPGSAHHWEKVRGTLRGGVTFGLLGALGQSVGVLLAEPAFDGPLDPWAGAAVRAAAGMAGLMLLRGWFEQRESTPRRVRMNWRLAAAIIVSGTIGMVIGKTLVLVALSGGDAGVVSVLVSTTPVLQLPVIWAITKSVPAPGAWIGAGLATGGTALIVF